jgi:hypothetical protein
MNTTSSRTNIKRKNKEQESSRKNLLKAEKYKALYLHKELLDDSFPCGKIV